MRKHVPHHNRLTFMLAVAACSCGLIAWTPGSAIAQQASSPDASSSQIAAESNRSQDVAKKIQDCTVTVRILRRVPSTKSTGDAAGQTSGSSSTPASEQSAAPANVTVCSGIAVGRGFVVTHDNIRESRAAAADRYRITLPDGKQAKAQLAVIDQYSQLHLLKVDPANLAGIAIAKITPKVGSRVMSGAAAGIDRAVVSIGMIGAVDRSLPGVYLPPLIQCDIRTLETSTGGAIVDLSGRLVGIVTYTDPPEKRNGWTYAVPASQVARLMRAHVKGELIVMGRRRPLVGMKLGMGKKKDVCIVEHVTKGGPADLAGIAPGDIVHEASGRKIRSPYQAVRQVMNRQPGDKLTMLIERNKSTKYVDVTLAGGAATVVGGPDPAEAMGLVQQNVNVKPTPQGGYEVTNQDKKPRIVAEPTVPGQTAPGQVVHAQQAPLKMSLDRVESLERELANYREEVVRLHKHLRHRDSVQTELQKLIAQMLSEIREMKKAQDEASASKASESSR